MLAISSSSVSWNTAGSKGRTRYFTATTATLSVLPGVIKSTSKRGAVTTVKYRNYTKEGSPRGGTNDPLGCLDSWWVSTLCSRERSRRKARFKAGVNFAARLREKETWKQRRKGLKRWLKTMKTLVVAAARYVALFSRELQINTPPLTPLTILCTSRALTIFFAFLSSLRFLLSKRKRDSIVGKIGLFHSQLVIFHRILPEFVGTLFARTRWNESEVCYLENWKIVNWCISHAIMVCEMQFNLFICKSIFMRFRRHRNIINRRKHWNFWASDREVCRVQAK